MVRIIFNADDFGYCEAVSLGIIKAHQDGLIKTTTIMINMEESTLHAVKLSKENPNLYVGLHSNIVIGKPCADASLVSSLVDDNGNFNTKFRLAQGLTLDPDEIRLEVSHQAEKFKSLFGHYPTHIEGHAIRDDGLFYAIRDVATELGVHYTDVKRSIDNEDQVGLHDYGYEIPEYPNIGYYMENVTYDYWLKDLGGMLDKDLVEMHTHPGYLDQFILDNSSYNLPRAKEVEIACSTELKQWVKDNNVELITFEDIKRTQ